MSRLTTFLVAVAALFVLALAAPANAAQRKADGVEKQQAGQYEISDRRYRRYYRRYYRPYYGYRPYYYGYPGYYGYGYPYGYYGAPGFSFGFRF